MALMSNMQSSKGRKKKAKVEEPKVEEVQEVEEVKVESEEKPFKFIIDKHGRRSIKIIR